MENEYIDRPLKCVDCGGDYVWTAGAQQFYADKGLTNPPKRCADCKVAKKERYAAQATGERQRVDTQVVCAQCGQETTVPFVPSGKSPVYCRPCFQIAKDS